MDSVREEGKKQTYLQCARAIKVKPKKSFNKKVKITESLTYDGFIYSLRSDEFNHESELPRRFLRLLDKKQRTQAILSFLDKTPYSSYTIMMKTFKRAIERFELTGDKEQLLTFKRNLTGGTEPLHHAFVLIREAIVLDLVNDDSAQAFHAIDEAIYGLTYNMTHENEEEFNHDKHFHETMKAFLIHAAAFKWPEATNLKILFGESNETK